MRRRRTERGRANEPRVRQEAASWIARLQNPGRDTEDERALRSWLESDPTHASAFHQATEVWEELGGVKPALKAARRRRDLTRAMTAVAAACVLAVFAGFNLGYLNTTAYVTEVGEQRSLALADGSRATLNTDTEIRVRYTPGQRAITLVRGEALFDVAQNPRRPFYVEAQGRTVRALGTSFAVLNTRRDLAVTLVDGKVAIASERRFSSPDTVNLSPGEQWRGDDGRVRALTADQLSNTMSWRRQELVFDNTPLDKAVAEMNRYTTQHIVVETSRADTLRLSGIFRLGETASFAKAVSGMYGIDVSVKTSRPN